MGFHPQLVYERRPGRVEHAAGIRLTSAAAERDHQLTGEPLAQRMLGEQRLELRHHLGVGAESEVRIDTVLQHRES